MFFRFSHSIYFPNSAPLSKPIFNSKSMISSLSFSNLNSITGFRTGIKPKSRCRVTCATAAAPPQSKAINLISSSSSTTLYDVLGVRSGATCREIKTAYRRLALERHPDVVEADRRVESSSEFIRIHTAYETLSDPDKRADYDRGTMVAALATAGRRRWEQSPPRGAQRQRPFYSRSPRTWETDQCW